MRQKEHISAIDPEMERIQLVSLSEPYNHESFCQIMNSELQRRKRLALGLMNSSCSLEQKKELQYLFDWSESRIKKMLLL